MGLGWGGGGSDPQDSVVGGGGEEGVSYPGDARGAHHIRHEQLRARKSCQGQRRGCCAQLQLLRARSLVKYST